MTMRSIAQLVGEHPALADLPPSDQELIAGCGRNVHFGAGTLLLREGDPADTFYLIRTGRVAIEIHHPGRAGLTVSTVGPGGLVGWSWLFPPYRWRSDARALDEVSAVAIDGACLRQKCDQDHSLGYRLMGRIAQVVIAALGDARLQLLDLYQP